jgi:trehalose utilization protein
MIRVTIWNEYRYEQTNPAVQEIYPAGIHQALAGFLQEEFLMQRSTG